MQVLQRTRVVDGGNESSVLSEDDVFGAALEAKASDGQRFEQGHVGWEVSVEGFLHIITECNVVDDG